MADPLRALVQQVTLVRLAPPRRALALLAQMVVRVRLVAAPFRVRVHLGTQERPAPPRLARVLLA